MISDPCPILGEALGGDDPGVSLAVLTGHQHGPLEYRRELCSEFLISMVMGEDKTFYIFIH